MTLSSEEFRLSSVYIIITYSVKIDKGSFYRGSYMSAHVSLNLLNVLRKRGNMWGLPSILSLFHNEFNQFNDTGVRMLDSINHMTLKLLKNILRENGIFFFIFMQLYFSLCNVNKSVNHKWPWFIDCIAWWYTTPRHNVR